MYLVVCIPIATCLYASLNKLIMNLQREREGGEREGEGGEGGREGERGGRNMPSLIRMSLNEATPTCEPSYTHPSSHHTASSVHNV